MERFRVFLNEAWVRRVFAVSWALGFLAAGAVLLMMRFDPRRVTAAELIIVPLLAALAVVATINVGSILMWLTKQIPRGFQRMATVLYPGSFLFGLYWSSRDYRDTAEILLLSLLVAFITAAAYLAAVHVSRWIADGFRG